MCEWCCSAQAEGGEGDSVEKLIFDFFSSILFNFNCASGVVLCKPSRAEGDSVEKLIAGCAVNALLKPGLDQYGITLNQHK